MKRLTVILNVIFLLALVAFLLVQAMRKPRVLVLHSYDESYAGWVPEVNEGVKRLMERKPYNVRYHYMDTKRHTDMEFKNRAGRNARVVIDKWQPDVLIAVDDNAQSLVAQHYINDPKVSIVFTGVNADAGAYGLTIDGERVTYDNADNVTGVLERINYSATRGILQEMLDVEKYPDRFPTGKVRVFHISDHSPTSIGIQKEIEHESWDPLLLVGSKMCDTFDEWKATIREAEKTSDILLVTHYHTIKKTDEAKSDRVSPAEVIKWTNENSKLPGISFWMFYVEHGGGLAVALSPFEQGTEAAKMAIQILEEGTKPSDIPVYTSRMFWIGMRKKAMLERLGDIKVPVILEAFAKANNNFKE